MAKTKLHFLEQSLNALIISHALAQQLFHRDVKNILLIHIGYIDAVMLDDLLTAYEKHGPVNSSPSRSTS